MGNQTHGEKITFYCTDGEAIELDEVALSLRKLGIRVDRGAVIRAALALTLPAFLADGPDSDLYDKLVPKEALSA